jgi:hypothetical protein
MHVLGTDGMPRRCFDYQIIFYKFHWINTFGLIGLLFSSLLFVLSIVIKETIFYFLLFLFLFIILFLFIFYYLFIFPLFSLFLFIFIILYSFYLYFVILFSIFFSLFLFFFLFLSFIFLYYFYLILFLFMIIYFYFIFILFLFLSYCFNNTLKRGVRIALRSKVNDSLITGLRIIDSILSVGRGQRQLILGDRYTGKTSIFISCLLYNNND